MLEDILAELLAEGFLVSNTFQLRGPPGAFGPPGWQVFLRNERNTRTGQGSGGTLAEALTVALANAMKGPTYESKQPITQPAHHNPPAYNNKKLVLGTELDDADASDLF